MYVLLRSKYNCAWSIRRDVGQSLRTQEGTPCSCYRALLVRFLICSDLRVSWSMPTYLFTEVAGIERSIEISIKAFLTCLLNGAKGFTFTKSTYLQRFSVLSRHVVSGQGLINLMQFKKFPLGFYHLEEIDAVCVIGTFS